MVDEVAASGMIAVGGDGVVEEEVVVVEVEEEDGAVVEGSVEVEEGEDEVLV